MLERIPTVLTAQEVLDKAFARAAKIDIYDPLKYHRIRKTEMARLRSATDSVAESLGKYPRAFPNLDHLRDYNVELLDVIVGLPALRKSLGSLKWAGEQVQKIGRDAGQRIDRGRSIDSFFQARKWAYGRISSICSEVDKDLDFVRNTRDVIRALPTVSPDYATIVIAGYPNVGKTSLLAAWTDSKAEIAAYAFTTKRAEVGHFEVRDAQDVATPYQVVDTPGLLDRPDAERNKVERQALAALRHAADAVLYIIDPSETCGYDLEAQEHLRGEVERDMTGIPMLVAESKCDLARRETERPVFSTTSEEGVEDLRRQVVALLEEEKEPDLEADPLDTWRRPEPSADGW